jgi:transcriptional regulator with XRE-family HTH domain
MTLSQYLSDRDMPPSDLAAALGLYPSTLYRILSGQRMPSLALAFAIERYTRGVVTAESFLPVDVDETLEAYQNRDKVGHGRRVRMRLRPHEAEAV